MFDLHDEIIDKLIGQNIRRERTKRGVSQDGLAQAIGVTFQQVQKYERAVNRVSASRLFRIGQALSVPIASFYQGLEVVADIPPGRADALIKMLLKPEMLRIVHACSEISDPVIRTLVLEVLSNPRKDIDSACRQHGGHYE